MKLRKLLVLLMLAIFTVGLSACGAQGEAGAQGPQGDKGETGAQGAKGPTGDQGMTGEDGDAGTDGVGIEFSFTSDGLAWRYVGDKTWTIGVTYSEIFAAINQAGVGQTIQKIGFDYVVDATLQASNGAEVDVYGIKKTMGTTAFNTIEDAFEAINADTSENEIKLFINAGEYSVGEGKEATLTKSNVLVYGPNVNVNPNTETRVSEATINSKVTFGGNNICVNGLNFATDGRIYGINTGMEDFTVAYVKFDETLTLKDSAASEGCLTLRIGSSLENANTMWYKNVTLAYSLFECNNARATRIVANQVDGFDCIGNVFNGKSNGIYDDCLKFYLWGEEKTAGFVSIKGNVNIYGNEFNNIGQYGIWLNSYGVINVDVQANKFVSVGMTDDKDSQISAGYIRGCLTALVAANYDYTQKSKFNFSYNYVSNASCGVRIENGGFTEENFEATVNYNVFDEIAVGSEIITNRGKNTLSLIDAQYNCFTAVSGVTLENNFKGVKSIDNQYASATQVPTKVLADLLVK